ncbi:MAG: ATP-binding protein [Oscillospiraceae bacterium]
MLQENFEQQQFKQRLETLVVFRALLRDEVLHSFLKLLRHWQGPKAAWHYGAFAAALYRSGGDFGRHLMEKVLEDENPAVRAAVAGALPAVLQQTMNSELSLFTALAAINPAGFAAQAGQGQPLPLWENTPADFAAEYNRRLGQLATKGYGVFAAFHMFTLGEGAQLKPVKNPDPQRLAGLTGYGRERGQVDTNTKALLKGLPANNILLYGDAGTGKSSTVKALANEYYGQGLRLVEVRKNQLYQIPLLMDSLAENPLKFIVFIDDLSFSSDDGGFTELKAMLEGSISARPRNIVVYATSNRRHMVQERFSTRQGDDLHLNDTLEEESSLAARFGLTITFLKPDRDLYAEIVKTLATEYGLKTPLPELLRLAEAHALRHGGRSPRTARQFVEYRKALEETQ